MSLATPRPLFSVSSLSRKREDDGAFNCLVPPCPQPGEPGYPTWSPSTGGPSTGSDPTGADPAPTAHLAALPPWLLLGLGLAAAAAVLRR